MGNPVPSQIRSVDPYASYDSNVVNQLTRIISDGENILLSPSPIDVSLINTTTVKALEGKAIMQDVLIEIQDHTVDLTDVDFYVDLSTGVWNEIGYYLVVLHYEYQKTSPPPEASVKIIKPSQKATVFDPNKHLFLKCLDVSNSGINEIDQVLDYDPDNPNINRDALITGANAGNFVATDRDTADLGASLYSVGSSGYDRFDKLWCKELNVESIVYTPPVSPPGSATYGTSVYGSGTYGDLAEKYTCNPAVILEPGTVIEMLVDEEFEVGICNDELSPFVMGVISADPAYILNSHLKNAALIGLVGRIPTKVIGPVKKKDILVSAGNGCLRAAMGPSEYGMKVGISLKTDLSESTKLIECFIK
jgi:hypothetical protein